MSKLNGRSNKFLLSMEPMLTNRESNALLDAINSAPLLDRLFTNVAGKIYWCIPSAPKSLRGKSYGIADSIQEAEFAIATLLATPIHQSLSA